MNKTTYIYVLIDPQTSLIRYVGKSDNPTFRFSNGHKYEKNHTYKCNWIKSLKKQGLLPLVEIIDQVPANTREEWRFWEKFYIDLFRSWGFPLTNSWEERDGAGLQSGTKLGRTKEHMDKIKQSKLKNGTWRKPHSEETKQKISKKNKGTKHTQETIDKRRQTLQSWPEEEYKELNKRKTRNKGKFVERGKEWVRFCKNKTLEQIYGEERGKDMKISYKTRQEKHKRKILQSSRVGTPIKEWVGLEATAKEIGVKIGQLFNACTKGKVLNECLWKYI